MNKLIETIARLFGVTAEDLRGNSRMRHIAEARQACCWALRHAYPLLSLEAIGDLLGGRDHTTIIYSLGRVEARMRSDARLAADLRALITEPQIAPVRRRKLNSAGSAWWAAQSRSDWLVLAA